MERSPALRRTRKVVARAQTLVMVKVLALVLALVLAAQAAGQSPLPGEVAEK
jgi:hypothetical protein